METKNWRDYIYYILIGIVSVCSLCFLPMLGTQLGMAFIFPTTAAGWFSWIIVKCLGAAVNVALFHLFICQGRANIHENDRYKEALKTLGKYHPKDYHPRSEGKWKRQTYGKKATTIFITTALASLGLTMAILQFDLVIFLSYLFTVGGGAIFGFLQQKVTEDYYTGEFCDYAEAVKNKCEEHTNDLQQ